MRRKILICDNEESLRALVHATLQIGDYNLIEAGDGETSLALAQAERPDVVVLDMMMPGKSGLEVVRELRAQPELAETRVLMLTARAQDSDRTAALSAGADDFLSKPFSPLELAARVERLLDS